MGEISDCPPTLKRSNQDQGRDFLKITLTFLEELESIGNAGLVTTEEKSSTMYSLSRMILCWRQLRSKLDPASHNSMGSDRNSFGRGRRNFKVVSGVGFPDVRSKWTT